MRFFELREAGRVGGLRVGEVAFGVVESYREGLEAGEEG